LLDYYLLKTTVLIVFYATRPASFKPHVKSHKLVVLRCVSYIYNSIILPVSVSQICFV